MIHSMRVRRSELLQRVPRGWWWFLWAAVALTALWQLAAALAPATGFTREYHYPFPRRTAPAAFDTTAISSVDDRAVSLDLAFIRQQSLPNRDYFIRWRGVWFSPRPERIDFSAGADDGVIVRVDGQVVIAVEMARRRHTVVLETGVHQVEIDHWQHGGTRTLGVEWGPVGGQLEPVGGTRVFPRDPGVHGYLLATVAGHLGTLVLLVWGAVAAIVSGRTAYLVGRAGYRVAAALTGSEVRSRLGAAVFPALLGPSQVLLFGPWTVHTTNRAEFLVPFVALAPRWIWLLGVIAGALAVLGVILPPRWFRGYVAALGAAGVLLWVQGNLLVAEYGLLDGGGLDLAAHAWRGPFEVCLWIAVVGLAMFFAHAVSRAAPAASVLLMSLQAVVLLGLTLGPPAGSSGDGDDAVAGWRLVPPEIYELSRSRNIIHIVLDMFPSHILAEIRDADRSTFDRAWSGFTFYGNHLGAFPTTMGSMPAMLTGIPYRNNMRISDYQRAHPSVFHALGQHGYRLRSLTADGRDHPRAAFPGAEEAITYTIPAPYGSYVSYVDSASAQVLDLSLFRHAPHGVKAGVYRRGEWLLQPWVTARWGPMAGAPRGLGDTAFLLDFANRIEAGGESPVYSFLHVITPHPPIATDAECEYVGGLVALTRARYVDQARCALTVVQTLVDRLRTLDLYDRSAIVVTSDHGLGVFPPRDAVASREGVPSGKSLLRMRIDAMPLLLVKPFGAEGPLQLSYAPTAITDLPATVLDLAGLPNTLGSGQSALALNPAMPRERTYADHSWGRYNTSRSQYFDILHLYSVNGQATSADAWRYRRAIFAPGAKRNAQYLAHRIGMSAVEDNTAEPSVGQVYRTDDYAAFFVRPDAERIAFDLQATDSASQTVTVRIDGHVVSRLALSGDTWRSIEYPVEPRDVGDSPFCIELLVGGPVTQSVESQSTGVMLRGGF